MPRRVELTGIHELQRAAEVLIKRVQEDGKPVVSSGARMIRDAARGTVPQRTGALKRSIISFTYRTKKRLGPAAVALVNLRDRGRSAKARHAVFIEGGTTWRRPKTKKWMVYRDDRGFAGLKGWKSGDLIFAKRTRPVTANPFWRRAVDGTGPAALQSVVDGLEAIISR